MTPDPPDEPATLDPAPRGWTREDTDALINAALIRDGRGDDIAFLPLTPEDTEYQRAQREAIGKPPTQAHLDAILEQIRHIPPPPWNRP